MTRAAGSGSEQEVFVINRGRASIHRVFQNRKLRDYTRDLPIRSVINLGATPDAIDKEGGRYRDYFPGALFKTLDTRPHDDPD